MRLRRRRRTTSGSLFAAWVACVFPDYAFPGCGHCGTAFGSAQEAIGHAPAHPDARVFELIVEAENAR